MYSMNGSYTVTTNKYVCMEHSQNRLGGCNYEQSGRWIQGFRGTCCLHLHIHNAEQPGTCHVNGADGCSTGHGSSRTSAWTTSLTWYYKVSLLNLILNGLVCWVTKVPLSIHIQLEDHVRCGWTPAGLENCNKNIWHQEDWQTVTGMFDNMQHDTSLFTFHSVCVLQ